MSKDISPCLAILNELEYAINKRKSIERNSTYGSEDRIQGYNDVLIIMYSIEKRLKSQTVNDEKADISHT